MTPIYEYIDAAAGFEIVLYKEERGTNPPVYVLKKHWFDKPEQNLEMLLRGCEAVPDPTDSALTCFRVWVEEELVKMRDRLDAAITGIE